MRHFTEWTKIPLIFFGTPPALQPLPFPFPSPKNVEVFWFQNMKVLWGSVSQTGQPFQNIRWVNSVDTKCFASLYKTQKQFILALESSSSEHIDFLPLSGDFQHPIVSHSIDVWKERTSCKLFQNCLLPPILAGSQAFLWVKMHSTLEDGNMRNYKTSVTFSMRK